MTKVKAITSQPGGTAHRLNSSEVVFFRLGSPRAVGIGFVPARNHAPIVTFIETGLGAIDMLKAAIEQRKVLCEDWRIVAILMARCELGHPIPFTLYRRVARVIAHGTVWRPYLPPGDAIALQGDHEGIWRDGRSWTTVAPATEEDRNEGK